MKTIFNLFRLNFLPKSPDLALLVLRLWIGASMLLLHGWTKIRDFSTFQKDFIDLLGMGKPASLALCIFAETVCSVLLAAGLFTRFAALCGAINMGVAFYVVHNMDLKLGAGGTGEMAFLYLAAYVTLFIAGGGRFGFDQQAPAKRRPRPSQD